MARVACLASVARMACTASASASATASDGVFSPGAAEVLPWSSVVEMGVGLGELDPHGLFALRARAFRDEVVEGVTAWPAWPAWPALLRLHRRDTGEAGVGVFARPDFALCLDQLACDVAFGVSARAARTSGIVPQGHFLRVVHALLCRRGLYPR